MSEKQRGTVGILLAALTIASALIGSVWTGRSYADDTARGATEEHRRELAKHESSQVARDEKVEDKLEKLDGKVEEVQKTQAAQTAKLDAILEQLRRGR